MSHVVDRHGRSLVIVERVRELAERFDHSLVRGAQCSLIWMP